MLRLSSADPSLFSLIVAGLLQELVPTLDIVALPLVCHVVRAATTILFLQRSESCLWASAVVRIGLHGTSVFSMVVSEAGLDGPTLDTITVQLSVIVILNVIQKDAILIKTSRRTSLGINAMLWRHSERALLRREPLRRL